jgi:hypothetical protein
MGKIVFYKVIEAGSTNPTKLPIETITFKSYDNIIKYDLKFQSFFYKKIKNKSSFYNIPLSDE